MITGSLSIFHGLQGMEHYAGAKGALAAMMKGLAVELGQYQVRANMLAPGFIMTPLTEKGLWGDPHRKQWLLDRIPARRPGKPEELAGAALQSWLGLPLRQHPSRASPAALRLPPSTTNLY